MLHIFTACFFGHRYVDDYLLAESRAYKEICRLIRQKEYVEFLVGRDGDFDQIVSSAIIRAKREVLDGNSSHVCVLPYARAEYRDNAKSFEKYYDAVEICELSAAAHRKAAIQTRNRNMVDRSDLCIFFVENNCGGAWQTMQYARKQGKRVINLAVERKERK